MVHVCNYLSSPRHDRYMQYTRNRQRRMSTQTRDYRIDFVQQMSQCCQRVSEIIYKVFGSFDINAKELM